MPVYFYWGEDDFALERAVKALRDEVLDPTWESFNYTQYPTDSAIAALNQAMTPPFGMGSRFVWLVNTNIAQQASESLLAELERTLPAIPDNSVLLLTSPNKPDGRLKSTKLLQKHAEVREFSPIPPWKTELLVKQVEQLKSEVGVSLSAKATELLAESVGNNTRQLFNELEKLKLYANGNRTLEVVDVEALVTATTQTSLELAKAIAQGNVERALDLINGLLSRNEPSLAIVATLVRQFRTWLWVKLMIEAKVRDDREIAQAAEIPNPNRIYFLRQEVRSLSLTQLCQTLPLLLELEISLKQGMPEMTALPTKAIEICQLYQVKNRVR